MLEQPYEFVQAQRTRLHEDLAILTGGLPVSTELSVSLHAIQLSQLGEADRVVIDGQTTTIIAGAGNEDAVAARIEQLRSGWPPATASTSSSSTSLRQRMARLGGRVAAIRVGADTEPELLERRHRVEDAVRATRAALTGGVVAGGGAALLHACGAIDAVGRGRRRRDRPGDGHARRAGQRRLDRQERPHDRVRGHRARLAAGIDLGAVFERSGARFVRQVASFTDEVAGDGTTTATVLAQPLVRHGLRNVAAGAHPTRAAARHRTRRGTGRRAPARRAGRRGVRPRPRSRASRRSPPATRRSAP